METPVKKRGRPRKIPKIVCKIKKEKIILQPNNSEVLEYEMTKKGSDTEVEYEIENTANECGESVVEEDKVMDESITAEEDLPSPAVPEEELDSVELNIALSAVFSNMETNPVVVPPLDPTSEEDSSIFYDFSMKKPKDETEFNIKDENIVEVIQASVPVETLESVPDLFTDKESMNMYPPGCSADCMQPTVVLENDLVIEEAKTKHDVSFTTSVNNTSHDEFDIIDFTRKRPRRSCTLNIGSMSDTSCASVIPKKKKPVKKKTQKKVIQSKSIQAKRIDLSVYKKPIINIIMNRPQRNHLAWLTSYQKWCSRLKSRAKKLLKYSILVFVNYKREMTVKHIKLFSNNHVETFQCFYLLGQTLIKPVISSQSENYTNVRQKIRKIIQSNPKFLNSISKPYRKTLLKTPVIPKQTVKVCTTKQIEVPLHLSISDKLVNVNFSFQLKQ